MIGEGIERWRAQILEEWNDTKVSYPRNATIHELIEEHVRRAPDALALRYVGGEMTYAELDARANALAAVLVTEGVGPDRLVGLCLERSPEAVVAIVAILKAGGAFAPLDPAYPEDRLAFMLEDTAAPVLITRRGLLERLPATSAKVICWEDLEDLKDCKDGKDLKRVSPENLAYVMYTSGSTGRPKGVAVTHRNVVRLARSSRFAEFGADHVFLHLGPLSFDATTLEVSYSLLNGSALAIMPPETPSLEELGGFLVWAGVTAAWITAGLFQQMVESQLDSLTHLRLIMSGGDVLSPLHVKRVLETAPGITMVNGYGPTESTVFTSCYPMHSPEEVKSPLPIGRPIGNTRVAVVDQDLRLAPPGAEGELWIGGDGLARGYLHRPDLTADRFVPDAFWGTGERLYRTGDLVRWRADGLLEFLGRVDFQVKIRGFRVELGEIEAALAAHPEVAEAAVVVQGEGGDKRLVAFWVGRSDEEPDLRGFLAERMPPHMVPGAFVRMDALPLNTNGKVDRRALAAITPIVSRSVSAAPRTPTEEVLAAIWAEVLGISEVGIDEDFFDLGGHSLIATRLVSRVSTELGVDLALRAVFENPTVAGLASLVDEERSSAGGRIPPVLPVPREPLLPASFAQERLWLIDRLTPGQSVYNIPIALRLRGPLDVAALESAFNALVRRHESLRTTFAEVDGRPWQRIAPFEPIELTVVEAPEAWSLLVEDALRPFNLEHGPLVRVSLYRMVEDDAWLLLNLHHIISDGWSMDVLTRELAALYAGHPLPELPVQYADFAIWQREWLAGEVLDRQIAWWVEELAGAPTLLELPADRPRPTTPSFRGVRIDLRLPAALAVGVSRVARQGGATLFMTTLAAFQSLLGRYTDRRDVLVGSPVANRTRRELEGVIGFFANTLVLRGRLEDGSFRERLARTRASALGAYAHQDLPFERLVEELRIERSLAYNPLFQVVFAFQPPPMQGLALPGVTLELADLQGLTSKFDLFLSLWESGNGFAGTIDAAADLFDPSTLERFARCFETLLEGLVEQPDRPVSELPLLAAAERAQVVEGWNDTRFPYPREASIHELFEEQVRLTPGAVALRFPGGQMTYAELDARAGALAGILVEAGLGPDRLAALCLERSAEAIVSMIAILKAGGAFVPLDPSYPADRLAFMLEDTAAPVLITRRHLLDRLPASAARIVCWEDLSSLPSLPSFGSFPSAPSNLAYVMYTSGSTGRPKGVAVTHRNVVRLVRNTNFADFGADQAFLQLAPLSFDASTMEIWGPLLNGGTLVVYPPENPTLEELGAFLSWEGITSLWLTAGLFHQMVEARLASLRGLRQLLAGGDVLSPPHVLRVLQEAPGVTLINGYGPTESTTFACCYPMRSPEAVGATVPIGYPIGNTWVAVLDRGFQPGFQPVPPGVVGELYIGGDGLARGYLNRPDLTAERFVPDPIFGDGERLYRTGDLARWTADGIVEFLGRADQQVKIRGFRIEPGEIESALASHPDVGEAAVVVQGEGAEKRLVAFWVDRSDAEPDLRAFLSESLPVHMVPSAFVRLDTLPLNPNGKVDRRALAAVSVSGAVHPISTAPRTPTEEVLAAIWAGLLGLDRVGIEDDFFALGGHSLLATRLVSRLSSELGVDLSLRTVFEEPTVARLAARVDEARAEGRPAPPILPVPRTGDPLPASFAQERLWLLDRLTPGLPVYNVPLALRLSGELDRECLEAALNAVVERHEALRTTFREAGGSAWQVVAPFEPRPLPAIDLTPAEAREKEARLALLPFDLAAGPLLRAVLISLGETDHVLLLTLHHIVGDGWSLEVLARDLGAFYTAFRQGEVADLPPLRVQYADYSVWQREWLTGDVLADLVGWWRGELAGAPTVLEVPADRPRPAAQSFRGGLQKATLPSEVAAAVRGLARREGATLFMTLLAAFQALLHRLTGQPDVLVGSPVANRNRPEIEGLVGFFVNTLVLRGRFPDGATFRGAVATARRAALGGYAHQDLPFEQLVVELRVDRSLAYSPLFQVMFVLQSGGFPAPEMPGLRAETVALETGTAKFDLLLEARESEDGIHLTLEHAADLFDASTAARLLERFGVLLEAAAAEPDRTVSSLPVMSRAERSQVLEAWNDAALDVPEVCLHDLVAAQMARTPDAVALVGDAGERWTYADLDRRASRIAARLRELGIGPEIPVGVSLPRTPGMVAALLGVLRAGGCYVPLDPAYPRERLALLLKDTAAPVVITESWLAGELPDGPVDSGVLPGNLAYLIYTSGSTGRPKGVAIEHRSAVAFAVWARQVFGDEELAGVFASTSINFDLSIFEIFVPLCWGGRVILGANALALPGHPAAGEVRLVNTVPSAMTELVRMGGIPSSVRTVNLAGEPLRRSLARSITAERLLNLYGPSEDTTYSTFTVVPLSDREPTIGRPLAGSRVYLFDRHGNPAPIGVAGELCLGGAGLARGYLGRPELTAEKFVPDPLGNPGERLYRTGDLARWLPHGEIEYLGRIDHQVKVRGFRIELGEIEAALLAHPGVRQAAVMAMGEGADRRLVAWVAPAQLPDQLPDLRSWLAARLPDYMVPALFVGLEMLPLTPNGKVDRKSLPAPERQETAGSVSAPPRTATEEVLAGLWADVLGLEGVGIDDDFFSLGGHSLLATRLISRIADSLGVELTLRQVFESPTVRTLSARLDSTVSERRGAGLQPIRPLPRTGGDFPLSLSQERLWFLDQMEPGRPLYNIPYAARFAGPLDVPALAAALNALVRRHESLRTTFPKVAGEPRQRIADPDGRVQPLPVVDLSGLPAQRVGAVAGRLLADAALWPFNLEEGPILYTVLLRLAPERHEMLFSVHHIVSDGWSMDLVQRDLAALYAGEPLPGLPVQYADYTVWQRESLQGEALAAEASYWRGELAGAPTLLDLPLDRPRPAAQTYRGGTLAVSYPSQLAAEAQAFARRQGATMFMTLLAAFQALLHRLSGEGGDVVVGSPIAGRGRREVEGVVGFFVNTLALRGRFGEEGLTFGRLLARTRATALAAYAHQDLSFERLVEELRVQRSLSYNPLIQVLFTVQDFQGHVEAMRDVEASWHALSLDTVKLDLELDLNERLQGRAGYASDLFDAATVERLVGHLGVLLGAALRNPETPVAELPLLTDAEARQLRDWSGSAWVVDEPPVHIQFAARAALAPEAVAVEMNGEILTYDDLQAKAETLARHLRAAGVGHGSRVGLYLERSIDLPAAILGIWNAGGAYVPLDPNLPEARIAYLIEDAIQGQHAPVIVTRDPQPFEGVDVVSLNEVWAVAPSPAHRRYQGRDGEGSSSSLHDLAYLIYTSGTTGKPKAVQVDHHNLAHTMRASRLAFGFAPSDRMPCLAAFTFDIFLFELFGPLLGGGTAVLFALKPTLDVPALVESLDGMTLLHAVPALMREVVDAAARKRVGSTLRRLFVGGDAVPADLLADMRRVFPQAMPTVLYGPTEATIICSSHDASGDEGRSLLGRPLPGCVVELRDRNGQPVPLGVAGEVWIGGPGVTRGYLHRPDLTAEKFVEGWYCSGDLARRLPDGTLEFLGRIDNQVKLRGFRIELGEIESVIAQESAVRQVTVLAVGEGSQKRLAAFVVSSEAGWGGEDILRERFATQLPDYMTPSSVTFLDELPLTAHGKVDRKALALLAPSHARQTGEWVAPHTATEVALAELWASLLGVERAGLTDNFFDLGGHSLIATRLVSRISETFGIDLPLRAVFEAPVLSELVALVEAAEGVEGPAAPLVPVPRDGSDLPLSLAQERLWFLDQLAPGQPFYNIPCAARLRGPLDVGRLAAALDGLVRRHETLRTTFLRTGGEPRQRIWPAAHRALPVVDLSSLPPGTADALAEHILVDAGLMPFDLVQGPLLRTFLVRLSPEHHELLFSIHHIVADGWSTEVVRRDLIALYQGEPLPELPVQYADFAVWQLRNLTGEALDREAAWWREELAGAPTLLDLPLDRPRPPVQSHRGGAVPVSFPTELAEAVRGFARRQRATMFMTLLAAFQTLLHRVSGNREGADVVVGSPIAGRGRAELERLIGFFVNTLALRGRFSEEGLSFSRLVDRTRTTALAAYAHQDLSFERLVEELRVERSLSYNPLIQVLFSVQDFEGGAVAMKDVEMAWRVLPLRSSKLDLELDLDEHLQGRVGYAADLFDPSTVRRLVGHLEVLLAAAVQHPDLPIDELPLLTEAEVRQLRQWSGHSLEVDEPPVHVQFAARAALAPDAVAVEMMGESLTYGELQTRAEALARHLRAAGVGGGSRVGLLLERSLDLPAAILGIWNAGGAYVPLDPNLPEARLAFQIDEAIRDQDAHVIVTRDPKSMEGIHIVSLTEVWAEAPSPAQQGRDGEGSSSSLTDLAYLIYTSGTTGQPKAVQVDHGNLAHTMRAARQTFGIASTDRMPCLAAFTFDIFLFELFGPLLAGGTVVLFPLKPTLDVPALVDSLDGMTLLHGVPALMREVVDGASRKGVGSSLRRLFVGGDAVPADLLADMCAVFPRAVTTVLYGPTEATIICSSHDAHGDEGRALLGLPLPGCVLDLHDRNGQLVPLGVPGEVWIGGPGVTRGYLNRPELTEETFVAGWYRSGDLARRLPDGTLEFLGRIDHQVKLRGFRIELGEIEAVLAQEPAVRQAAVLAIGEDGTQKHLAVFAVVSEPHAVSGSEEMEDALRSRLAARLPEYMVPSSFTFVDTLPLTAHGKVDRKALARLAPARRQEAEWVAPATATEVGLAGLWSDLLGAERVGRRDHFFELGGHSLIATRLISRVSDAFGVELPLRSIFEAPVLADLASRVDAALAAGPDAAPVAPPIVPVSRDGDLPLAFAQERLWFSYLLAPERAQYIITAPLRLSGLLDVRALQSAFTEIVRRHEILRTTYEQREGRGVQRVSPPSLVALPVVDLGALPHEVREAEMLRIAALEETVPIDLRRGPVHRFRLVRMADDDWLLILSIHHVASDGWSTGILLQELADLYGGASLKPLPVQYGDYAVWQRRWLQGEALERLIGSWQHALEGAPVRINLPTDRPRPAVRANQGATLTMTLPKEVAAKVDAVSRRLGATPFMTFFAAYEVLLHRLTGHDDVLVGTPVAGRNRAETEGLIGCFVNTVVLRGRNEKGERSSFRELVGGVRSMALHAFAHQDVPFEKLVEALGGERNLAWNPLFQVFFALQNAPIGQVGLPGVTMTPVEVPSGVTLFDLALGLGEFRGEILGGMQYATDLFDASTIERWARHFRLLLEAALENPDLPIADLPRIAEPERLQLVATAEEPQPEETAEALQARLSAREEEVAERRSALSDQKRAALQKLLQRKAK
ncbi:MAG TPA: non-ribosomal peptide synthase/polyketide synthase [Thermoanaerobaculia bacterium]|nr:non-ribosomal peptide synthase/polyketide synthase [Thermoanaerobaculia bacterium]